MKFLEQVARYYTAPARIDSLADITFIFPNKRSALFLEKYIRLGITSKYMLMPRFTTFARFAAHTVSMNETSRHELLFMLYDAYVTAVMEQNSESGAMQVKDFDKFIFWGDMILSDFDEIDKSLADPRILYTNIKNLHELTADYLTDEQKEVVRRVWGDTPLTMQYVDRFWLHTRGADKDNPRETDLTRKFLSLWQILARIYELLRERLKASHHGTPGMQMREALSVIRNTPASELRRRKYVFVGLSELSNAELAIMDRLKAADAAEFFWDFESPLFHDSDGNALHHNRAFAFLSRMAREYPMPQDFTIEPIHNYPIIDIIGLPSAVAQAKCAGDLIHRLHAAGELSGARATDTAVVLPDPELLTPLMLSLPDSLPAVNVTMGLPYTSTNFATLFGAIISMQKRARKLGGRYAFFYQDVLEILLHPHMLQVDPQRVQTMRRRILDDKRFNIDADELAAEFPELAFIFTPVKNLGSLEESYDYVSGLLDGLIQAFESRIDADRYSESFERGFLEYFRRRTAELRDLMVQYNITMRETTFLALFERNLQAMNHNMEGTPLQGMQVMGVLETRALDFDNIVFLSMNERTFPRRDYTKTMIPNNLRRGYGLPPIEQSESFYSYHFFRALSRARHATLLYDTRLESDGSGEISRYLSQLQYLYPDAQVSHQRLDVTGSVPSTRSISIGKTPEVMAMLRQFMPGGNRYLSASSLKSYLKCGLRFYLEYIVGLRDTEEPVDYLNAAQLGNIFHNTANYLFEPYVNALIDDKAFNEMLNSGRLDEILLQEVATALGIRKLGTIKQSDLSVEGQLALAQIRAQLLSMLIAEQDKYLSGPHNGFTYIGGEEEYKVPWQITPDLAINFKMIVDRIDRTDTGNLRFIDYKTGADDHGVGDSLSNLFSGEHKREAIFQLLLYAEAYQCTIDPTVTITPALHIIKDIMKEGEIHDLTFNRKKLPAYAPGSELAKEFRAILNEKLSAIFDSTTPFEQTDKEDRCTYCNFASLCNRMKSKSY